MADNKTSKVTMINEALVVLRFLYKKTEDKEIKGFIRHGLMDAVVEAEKASTITACLDEAWDLVTGETELPSNLPMAPGVEITIGDEAVLGHFTDRAISLIEGYLRKELVKAEKADRQLCVDSLLGSLGQNIGETIMNDGKLLAQLGKGLSFITVRDAIKAAVSRALDLSEDATAHLRSDDVTQAWLLNFFKELEFFVSTI